LDCKALSLVESKINQQQKTAKFFWHKAS